MALACDPDRRAPDAALASALARDLERAFEPLVIAYRERIVTFVARMLHDDARAEDIAQDVFVRAYRALQSYPPERRAALRLRSWLYAIAHNLTRNAVRDTAPPGDALEREDGTLRAGLDEAAPGPEEIVLKAETRASIDASIAALSAALRPAFVMRYIDELSYDEIAHVLQAPLGTVKASAHRGLLAVRARLENDHA
ncbi:MAG: RNA polymerase sigma factor SigW [Candidatus Velthaea sp.]